MKKILMVLCTVIILLPSFVIPITCEDNLNLYPENIIVDETFLSLPVEKQQLLLNYINSNFEMKNSANASDFNLLCLFGHDIQSGAFMVTTHNMYPTVPKCVKETYSYELCLRNGCDFYETQLLSRFPLNCH